MFYTEGDVELRDARLRIAKYSLPRAQIRIDMERQNAAAGSKGQDGGGGFLGEIERLANSIGPYVVQES